jgi:hypothetical protein
MSHTPTTGRLAPNVRFTPEGFSLREATIVGGNRLSYPMKTIPEPMQATNDSASTEIVLLRHTQIHIFSSS